MPHAMENHVSGMDAAPSGPRKLVLCLDGTGNQFQGFERDSNIVKIYQMLEKNTPNQYHYYQRRSSPSIAARCYTAGQITLY